MADLIKARAYIEGVAQSNRKVAIVASLVRRRTVADALVILSHVPRRAALPVIKAIKSAQANAINNLNADTKSLAISTISVTSGTRLKRYVPASKGRALPFDKKTSNILVEITGEVKAKKAATTTVKTTSAVAKEAK